MAKLLTEEVNEYRTLYESAGDGKKSLFIEGIFLQSNIKNRNGRIYPKHIMDKEVRRYVKESVDRKSAFGELNHPQGPTINLDKVSHIITDLREDGDNYIGKAKILETPMGQIARNIIEGGGQLAVSSRGVGSLKKSASGTMEVQEDFMLSTAADIVSNPSAPDAYVDAIMEAPDWVFDAVRQEWLMQEAIAELHTITKANLDESKLWSAFQKFSKSFDLTEALKDSMIGKDVHMHVGGPRNGYIAKGRITRFDQSKDVIEITWNKGHQMANDRYIARISQVSLINHGKNYVIV